MPYHRCRVRIPRHLWFLTRTCRGFHNLSRIETSTQYNCLYIWVVADCLAVRHSSISLEDCHTSLRGVVREAAGISLWPRQKLELQYSKRECQHTRVRYLLLWILYVVSGEGHRTGLAATNQGGLANVLTQHGHILPRKGWTKVSRDSNAF